MVDNMPPADFVESSETTARLAGRDDKMKFLRGRHVVSSSEEHYILI
jgi:hypothetical protein